MHTFSRTDFLDTAAFQKCRTEKQKEIMALKESRRVAVGPFAMFYFECFDTLWWQIQEMLRVEGGGEAQLEEELSAYTPLLPQGSDFRVTLMLEIPDATERLSVLKLLGGIEQKIELHIGNTCVTAVPLDPEENRTTADGKTSAVHFIRFPLLSPEKASFLQSTPPAIFLQITHPHYTFRSEIPKKMVQELQKDLL
ncbi:MAG: DUF3501 family protein [Holosporales bacterium]|nr:DUF3501 family protein [Holosporales bacterium]